MQTVRLKRNSRDNPNQPLDLLTDLLDGGWALPEHAQGSVHDLPMEPPGGTVVPERDVFPVPGQYICGDLEENEKLQK